MIWKHYIFLFSYHFNINGDIVAKFVVSNEIKRKANRLQSGYNMKL